MKRLMTTLVVLVAVAAMGISDTPVHAQSTADAYSQLLTELKAMGQRASRSTSQGEVLAAIAEMKGLLMEFRTNNAGTPEAADAAFQLGTLLMTQGQLTQNPDDYAESARYLSEYIVSPPADAPRENVAAAHFYLGEAYKNSGKYEDAKREYEVVLKDYSDVNERLTQFARTNLQDLDVQKRLAIGGEPIPFEVTSTAGQPLSPAKFKGKVLLLDFWATWCGPCKVEMPHVKKVYEKYKDKGFEIVGISLDRSRADLDKYVEGNQIPWPQYFDGKFWNNDVATQYGVRSIPATYLIDKKGKIRYTSLRGKALETAVEKLLNEDA